MLPRPVPVALLASFLAALAACDKDPSTALAAFNLTACPTGLLGVNAPITLSFSQPVSPTAVGAGNVVVSNALTGVELAGSLSLQNNGTQVVFTPSTPLPFQTRLRIRLQNLIAQNGNVPLPLTVCEVSTALPPITQLFWSRLPLVSGNRIPGGSMYKPDSGYIAIATVPIFRRTPGGWEVVFNQPYFQSSFDAAFPTRTHGFTSHLDTRNFRGVIQESFDAGATFDTVFAIPGETVNRLLFRPRATGSATYFGVATGGSAIRARLIKYVPETPGFTSVATFGNTGFGTDVDFGTDTTSGAATSSGTQFANGTLFPGRVFTTSNGGSSWSEVANAVANDRAVAWDGVARRNNGEIYITGGGGYIMRLTPSGGGGYTVARILENAVTNPDSTNYQALEYTDVQFAPDNDQKGWIVGAQLVPPASANAVPQFRGVIFETTDGGRNWTRQGVKDAPNSGAEFPRLNRIVAFSSTSVWLLGDGGVVLRYQP